MTPHALGQFNSLHIGKVLDNDDPEGRGRIKVALQVGGTELWASVLVGSAGNGYGVSFQPRIDELVVIAFVSPEVPLVMGAIWSGQDTMPDDASPVESRYAIETPSGLKLTFDDENGPNITAKTPNGYEVQITDEGGGEIHIKGGSEEISLTSSGISIQAGGQVEISASQVKVEASMVQVNAGMSQFSGVVQCDTLITNSVVSSSYTPGAGNIW